MDKKETRQLLVLLEQYYPNKKFRDPKTLLAAWALALEPYDYEQVKQSAALYAASNKFFPDLADITVGLKRFSEPTRTVKDDVLLLRRILDQQKSEGDNDA
ncbi:MAG: replicative helicase loader/inhibitor [Bacteroides sp.]